MKIHKMKGRAWLLSELFYIAMTDKLPNDTIVVRPDMDPAWKQKIQDAFISLGQDPLGKKVIVDIFSHYGYAKSEDEKFDFTRQVLDIMEGE
ncbi:PhnD/SsuA/transferrin family substrate-binding protein [Paenibacillus thalictri]|uniref:Uncharacterized protein n=1 Tax=Paenibacillus thalictri TaxID=2527873 RepID=A0A4Q9DY62_9BACL|nr:PhnD/SsuA/transferrin family substrate-binding protein [Paenibacillus thalictri]TBL80833.1 hypothetical protein EYB31_06345 [Paenibacillus thalictri]